MEQKEQVLYIIMRTDMNSLNPGKAMAQASHAYGALKHRIRSNLVKQKDYLRWMDQTPQEFGTTIVLGCDEGGINAHLCRVARFHKNLVAGWVHDPTYPLRDGAVTHLIPINTCAFVFGDREDAADALTGLELHP